MTTLILTARSTALNDGPAILFFAALLASTFLI